MAYLVSGLGGRVDLEIVKGEESTYSVTLTNASGASITSITSATVVFKTGSLASPGSAVSGLTITPSVAASTTISWTMTDSQTELAALTVGDDFCWFLTVTYSDGIIQEIFRGNAAFFEGAS